MLLRLLKATAIVLALPFDVLANPHNSHHARHNEIAKRAKGDLSKRQYHSGTRWTWYDVGLGACGVVNYPGDFIVALNSAEYGDGYPGPHCFQQIRMRFGGKETIATVMDQCPGCPWGGLDLSIGLFQFFADLGAGVLTGDWEFVNGGGGGQNTPPPQTTPPPYTPPPTTSTQQAPPTSSTQQQQASSTQSSSSSSATPSETPIDWEAGAAAGLGSSKGTINDDGVQPQNILDANSAFIRLGGLAVAGAHVSDD